MKKILYFTLLMTCLALGAFAQNGVRADELDSVTVFSDDMYVWIYNPNTNPQSKRFTIWRLDQRYAPWNGSNVDVSSGGTGLNSFTPYAPIFGGTSGTGSLQSGTVGSAGQVLTSNGAGALPTFQDAAGGGGGFAGSSGNINYSDGSGSGSASLLEIVAGNRINSTSTNQLEISSGSGNIVIRDNLIPLLSGLANLGGTNTAYIGTYTNLLSSGTGSPLTIDGASGILIADRLDPDGNNTRGLGGFGASWGDAYMDRIFLFNSGTAGQPEICFSSDSNTGLYRSGNDELSITTGGAQRFSVSTSVTTSEVPIRAQFGSSGTPSFSFDGNLNTGMYRFGSGQIGFSGAGVNVFTVGYDMGTIITNNADPDTNLTNATEGALAWDSTDDEVRVYNGSTWSTLGGGSGPTEGQYVPTISGQLNISSASASGSGLRYVRNGDTVTVYGTFNVTPTAASTEARFQITLPISTNFINAGDAAGGGSYRGSSSVSSVHVVGNTTNDSVFFAFYPDNNSVSALAMSFTYFVQ